MGVNPTYTSFVGIAKETTPGTPVAATAFIPVTAASPQDNAAMLMDAGWRGSAVQNYDAIGGPIDATFGYDGDLFPDTIGWALTAILGDLATTGASAPYTHVLSVLNSGDTQPPSYTLTDFYSAATRQYAGCKASEVTIKFTNDGLLQASVKWAGFGSATTSKPTASFSSVQPLPAWVGAVSIGGSTTSDVLDGEVTIKRAVSAIRTVAGVQTPYKLFSGPVQVTGKLTLLMQDDAHLTNYLTNAKPAVDLNFQTGAAAAAVQVLLHMSKCAYTAAAPDRGSDYVKIPVDFEALANSTDVGASGGYSPIKATLKNAVASGTYK